MHYFAGGPLHRIGSIGALSQSSQSQITMYSRCRYADVFELQASLRPGQRTGQAGGSQAEDDHGRRERFALCRDRVAGGERELEAEDVDGVLEAIHQGRTRILGRRTPHKFFIGNTVTYIYKAIVKNGRRV
jgi:hypothetical protein